MTHNFVIITKNTNKYNFPFCFDNTNYESAKMSKLNSKLYSAPLDQAGKEIQVNFFDFNGMC